MINWLSSLPGVVLGYTKLEQMMIDFNGSVEPLLAYEEFTVQLKTGNPKVLEFVKREAVTLIRKFLEILVQEYNEECIASNYEKYIAFPAAVVEILESEVPALLAPFFDQNTSEELLLQTFSLVLRCSVPEPQLNQLNRVANLLIAKGASQVSRVVFLSKAMHKNQQQPVVNFFLNHIQSQAAANIVISLFNPENQQPVIRDDTSVVKLEFLTLIVKGFDLLEPLAVLNVTLLLHEIMSHYNQMDGAQPLVKYITSAEVLNKMFDVLEANQNHIVTKSAAHVLSLVSNYYSYSMQNISVFEPDEESDYYNSQLTELFESSQFMDVFMRRLYIIADHIKTRKLSVVNLKLVEIVDNIVRISNLKLWKRLAELNAIQHLIGMFFAFPNANILHSLVEKLVLYAFNRTISDFHPFWGLAIVTDHSLCEMLNVKIIKENRLGPYLQLANNLNWFQKELTEKMILSGDHIKYYRYVRKIVHHFENNIEWIDCQLALINLNKRNRIELGSGFVKPMPTTPQHLPQNNLDDRFKDRIFQQTKTNQANIQQLAVSGDDPVPFDDQPLYLDEPEERRESEEVVAVVVATSPAPNEDAVEEEQPAPVLKSSLSTEPLKIPIVAEVATAKDYKYESFSPYSPRKNMMKLSGGMSSSSSEDEEEEDLELLKQERNRRNSEQLESSTKLKQISEEHHEFQIVRRHSQRFDEKLIIQPQNMKVLKVDEIDMNSSGKLNESFSSIGSRGSMRKIKVSIKEECKVVKYEEDAGLSNSQILMTDSFASKSLGDSQTLMPEEKKFRKIQEKDKKFLNFLNSIK